VSVEARPRSAKGDCGPAEFRDRCHEILGAPTGRPRISVLRGAVKIPVNFTAILKSGDMKRNIV